MKSQKWEVVGKLLGLCRVSIGYSQQNMADELHVDQSLISKIEKGHSPASYELLINWIDITYEGWSIMGKTRRMLEQIQSLFDKPRMAI